MQKFASGGDLNLAVGIGEQPVVADAMKAGGQHVQQEAAHELLGPQGHCFVARPAVGSIVFPTEGDAVFVRADEPGVGERHPMGVARQISEHVFGTLSTGRVLPDSSSGSSRCVQSITLMLFWRSGPRFGAMPNFRLGGCHHADEPIYVGPVLPPLVY